MCYFHLLYRARWDTHFKIEQMQSLYNMMVGGAWHQDYSLHGRRA
jgi:hypothetical protein